ncbi:putative desiccation-related protein LEA14 [Forsythia ovata]|uniref:Desiccation-related protein LEA14 n=1 Tax=Forsythia ovata TaxID=205694 RepID=A0ABD1PXZ5_9LAMI
MSSSKQFLSKLGRSLKTMPFTKKTNNFTTNKVPVTRRQPEASITAVEVKDVGRDGITLLAKVSVHNPYPVPIPISDITFSLKSTGREIATGKAPDPGFLKANDNTMLNVSIKVPYNGLMGLAQDISADWDIDYVLDLGLIVDLPLMGNITIPVSYKGEMKIPTFGFV